MSSRAEKAATHGSEEADRSDREEDSLAEDHVGRSAEVVINKSVRRSEYGAAVDEEDVGSEGGESQTEESVPFRPLLLYRPRRLFWDSA
jgi:hypothetical protein